MRIERWLTVVALASATSAAAAGAGYEVNPSAPPHGEIDVRVLRRTEMHPREELRKVCRAGRDVDGCTDFPIEKLECRCERKGDVWVMDAFATLQTVTHFRSEGQHARLMAHEELHLIDLTEGLTKHLENLASRTFESGVRCRKYARFLSTSPHLRVVMNKLRVASNTKFGCAKGR